MNIEPQGEERADLRAGIIASVIANTNRNPKRKTEPFQPFDFMPLVEGERKKAEMARREAMGEETYREQSFKSVLGNLKKLAKQRERKAMKPNGRG